MFEGKFYESYMPPFFIGDGKFFKDNRGAFCPLRVLGATEQVNVSYSAPNTVRGMHWQRLHQQSKLVSCIRGTIHDVCVDLRRDSPTRNQQFEYYLDGESGKQLYVPAGFAHGFEVIGDSEAIVLYMVSEKYDKKDERGFLWSSLDCWKVDFEKAIVSDKDKSLPKIQELRVDDLPVDEVTRMSIINTGDVAIF